MCVHDISLLTWTPDTFEQIQVIDIFALHTEALPLKQACNAAIMCSQWLYKLVLHLLGICIIFPMQVEWLCTYKSKTISIITLNIFCLI